MSLLQEGHCGFIFTNTQKQIAIEKESYCIKFTKSITNYACMHAYMHVHACMYAGRQAYMHEDKHACLTVEARQTCMYPDSQACMHGGKQAEMLLHACMLV